MMIFFSNHNSCNCNFFVISSKRDGIEENSFSKEEEMRENVVVANMDVM